MSISKLRLWGRASMVLALLMLALASTAQVRTPGDHDGTVAWGGQQRPYRVHVPQHYQPGQAWPLLLALHGGGGHYKLMADDARYGLISLSEREGVIVVFANGYSRWPGGQLATWNAGRCCGAARDLPSDDAGMLRALLAQVQGQLNVDPQRIYATGMSNGGMLAHRLACDMADVLAGIAAVAGTDNTVQCTPSKPVPVLMIHARDDDHVLFAGGAGPQAFRDARQVTPFRSVPDTAQAWVRRNQCGAQPTRVLDTPGAYCDRYAACSQGAAVQLCVTENGGHSWPGGTPLRAGQAPPSQAIAATTVMWDFFSSLPR
jgi:polyhydroxybutyrate depolymerase